MVGFLAGSDLGQAPKQRCSRMRCYPTFFLREMHVCALSMRNNAMLLVLRMRNSVSLILKGFEFFPLIRGLQNETFFSQL
jgi:hypothetical protein